MYRQRPTRERERKKEPGTAAGYRACRGSSTGGGGGDERPSPYVVHEGRRAAATAEGAGELSHLTCEEGVECVSHDPCATHIHHTSHRRHAATESAAGLGGGEIERRKESERGPRSGEGMLTTPRPCDTQKNMRRRRTDTYAARGIQPSFFWRWHLPANLPPLSPRLCHACSETGGGSNTPLPTHDGAADGPSTTTVVVSPCCSCFVD